MNRATEKESLYAIELMGLTIQNDRKRDTEREYAIQGLTLAIPKTGRTLIFGLPNAGKTAMYAAIVNAKFYPESIRINTHLHKLPLRDSRSWSTERYKQKYFPFIQEGDFLVTDEPYDQAFGFLHTLKNGMLVFAGVDGYQFMDHFNLITCLKRGRIIFSGDFLDFLKWIKVTNQPELKNHLGKSRLVAWFEKYLGEE